MSVLSLVFDGAKSLLGDITGQGAPPKIGVGRVSIGVIELDAAISETHQYKSDVTSLPIETGGNITDHAILQPLQLTIEGFITNSPIKQAGNSGDGGEGLGGVLTNLANEALGGFNIGTVAGNAIGSAIGGRVGSTVGSVIGGLLGNAIQPPKNYVDIAFKQMIKLREARTPIAIVTTLDVYINMVMTSLTIPRDRSVGDALRFTAEFIQITRARSEEITIPADVVADQATASKDAGRQTTEVASTAVEQKSSLLYKLVK